MQSGMKNRRVLFFRYSSFTIFVTMKIGAVRHSQVGSMISVCLCTLFSLSLSWNSKIPPLGRIKLKRALFCSALAYMYLCHYGDRMRFGIAKSEMKFPFVSVLTFRYLCIKWITDCSTTEIPKLRLSSLTLFFKKKLCIKKSRYSY